MYSPEEFAQKLKWRGIFQYIADARKYVKQTGKETFDEPDFEEAYRAINNRIGHNIIKDMVDGEATYYQLRDDEFYWEM